MLPKENSVDGLSKYFWKYSNVLSDTGLIFYNKHLYTIRCDFTLPFVYVTLYFYLSRAFQNDVNYTFHKEYIAYDLRSNFACFNIFEYILKFM